MPAFFLGARNHLCCRIVGRSDTGLVLSLAAACAVLLSAVGCGSANDPEDLLADYVGRVENVTEVDVLDGEGYRAGLLAYPERRDRRLPLADVRIGMLDFLVLIQCGLQEIVGERNSALGKVMPVSQQLIYEHRLLVSARQCRRQLEDKDSNILELQRTLDEVVSIKTAELPKAYWNATFGSPEFERMFSLAAPPLRIDAAAKSNADIEGALLHLADLGERLGEATLNLESTPLEAQYKAINSRRVAGELLGALDLLRFHLDAAASAIETRLEERPVCYNKRPTPKARIFDNVFRKQYVDRVQPYLARVHRQARDWLTLVNRLASAQEGQMTPVFAAYFEAQLSMEAEGALWSRYQRALARHTEAWQTVLAQCGLMPGKT